MTGDPARAGKVILRLADEQDLPLRFQLGSDAYGLVQGQARKTLGDQEKWKSISFSTDADDRDIDHLSHIAERLGGVH